MVRKSWIVALKRVNLRETQRLWEPSKGDAVCSVHFKEDDFRNTKTRQLKLNVVPSLFSHHGVAEEIPTSSRAIRYVESYGQVPVLENPDPTPSEDHFKFKLKRVREDLHNTKRREKRLRDTVSSLRRELFEEKQISEGLATRLDVYKGKSSGYCSLFSLMINAGCAPLAMLCHCTSITFHLYRYTSRPLQEGWKCLFGEHASILSHAQPLQSQRLRVRP